MGGLYRGQSIPAISTTKSGWTKVRFNGSTAYISSRYLTRSGKGAPVAPVKINTASTKITTARLNVRTGPSLQGKVVGVIGTGSIVKLTGKYSRGFSEIVYANSRRWVTTQYLASSTRGLPEITGTRTATADLMVRTTADEDFKVVTEIKKGGQVSITGATQNGRAQIIYNNAVRWVTAKYLSTAGATRPTTPALPRVTGTRYATAPLDIRSASGTNHKVLGEVPRGTRLSITGVTQNGRAQVIYNNAVRWVTAQYLSTSRPAASPPAPSTGSIGGSGLATLRPTTKRVLFAAHAAFPQVTTFYGVRPDAIPDHPSGKALDIMLPNYQSASGKALGGRIAAWAQANQSQLNIEYVIWNQHIWNVKRADEGWRFMADRGGDSANHKNHVHITVLN
ncbi:uncharacterized protein YgiM (DUF1202 family) [Microlunatus panaciterrae]|uniref:Uncharacterized protein YgiM (DUF1202 family) n=1 Tax=Microlunatus panaciterrae TaxID=400768 RepID=A0ABS2RKZ7_9ACTN|nr:uncharacterized protein YgiM (DUF1202 family) [Microlunatus panaciterrae]